MSVELPHFQHQTLDLPTLAPLPVAPAVPVAAPPVAPTPSAPPPPVVAAPAPVAVAPPAAPPTSRTAPSAAGTGVAASPAAARRWSVEETERRLLQPQGRDDVARALIDFAAGLVQRAVLFVVRKEEVAAWLWSGNGVDEARLKAVRLSLKPPSLFAGLKEEGAQFRGPLPNLASHQALAACFHSPAISGELLVLPVKVKERLVAALVLSPPWRPGGPAGRSRRPAARDREGRNRLRALHHAVEVAPGMSPSTAALTLPTVAARFAERSLQR